MMDDLIDDYDNHLILIEVLANAIERYEDQAEEFELFNQRQQDIDPAIATLKVLMQQHNLNTTDFEQEIGKKSMVSQVLSGKRCLSRQHISKLAARFGVSAGVFF